mgnify:CR=1 FL=1
MGNISAQICFFKSTHPFFLKAMPSFSSSSLCSVQLGANLPWLFTTLCKGKYGADAWKSNRGYEYPAVRRLDPRRRVWSRDHFTEESFRTDQRSFSTPAKTGSANCRYAAPCGRSRWNCPVCISSRAVQINFLGGGTMMRPVSYTHLTLPTIRLV